MANLPPLWGSFPWLSPMSQFSSVFWINIHYLPTATFFCRWLSATQKCLQETVVEYNSTGHGLILGENSEVQEYRSEKRLNCWALQRWGFLCRAGYSKHGGTWNDEGRVGKGEREIGIQSLRFLWMHEMGDFNPCSCYLSAFITLLCISSPESFQGDLYHLIKYIFFSGKRSLCIQKEKNVLLLLLKFVGGKKIIRALFVKHRVKFLRSYGEC